MANELLTAQQDMDSRDDQESDPQSPTGTDTNVNQVPIDHVTTTQNSGEAGQLDSGRTHYPLVKDLSDETLTEIKNILNLGTRDDASERKHMLRLSVELMISSLLYKVQILLQQNQMEKQTRLSLAEILIRQAFSIARLLESQDLTARCHFWIGAIKLENTDMIAALNAFVLAGDAFIPDCVESQLLSLCYRKYWHELMVHVESYADYEGFREPIKEKIQKIANEDVSAVTYNTQHRVYITSEASVNPETGSEPSDRYTYRIPRLISNGTSEPDRQAPAQLLTSAENRNPRTESEGSVDRVNREQRLIRPRTRTRPQHVPVSNRNIGCTKPSWLDMIAQRINMLMNINNIEPIIPNPAAEFQAVTNATDGRRGAEGELPGTGTGVSGDRSSTGSDLFNRLLKDLQEPSALKSGVVERPQDSTRSPTSAGNSESSETWNSDGQRRTEEDLAGLYERNSWSTQQSSNLSTAHPIQIEGNEQSGNSVQGDVAEFTADNVVEGHNDAASSVVSGPLLNTDTEAQNDGSTQPEGTDPLDSSSFVDNNLHTELPSNRSSSSSQSPFDTLIPDRESESNTKPGDLTDALAPEEIEQRVRVTSGRRLSLSIDTRSFPSPEMVRLPLSASSRSPWSAQGRRGTEPIIHSPLRSTMLP